MHARKKQLEELFEDFGAMKRAITLECQGMHDMPRITPSQWSVLMFIEHKKTASVKEVASTIRISSSAATQLIEGLVKNGFVTKTADKNDKRSSHLALTKSTQKHFVAMKKNALQSFHKVFKVLTDAEFKTYCIINRKIAQGLSVEA